VVRANTPDADRAGDFPEARLIERALRGDSAAFEALYRAHVRAVYRFLRMQVGDDALAEDLTQDVFVAAYRGLRTFREGLPFGPWIMTIARHQLVNHHRHRSRRPTAEPLPETGLAAPAEDSDWAWAVGAEGLNAALGRLTRLQRQVLGLRFGAELSIRETAASMHRSENAVKNLQFKALAALRRSLDEAV
jgi:RNA polymerase sigma-70 factor (ECF subfamily)